MGAAARRTRNLRAAPATVAVTKEVLRMADVAYMLVVVAGFALFALVLRGLERL